MSKSYIKVNEEAGYKFFSKDHTAPVVMLNMLKFKKIADYSSYPDLAPLLKTTGKEAYLKYVSEVSPMLKKIGSKVIFSGSADDYLIGPSDENWDAVLLVKHLNVKEFLNFTSDPEYLAISGHRTAALQDSRLLPLFEGGLF